MSKLQKYVSAALSLLFGMAVLLFYILKYRYHVYFQEQFQLFEWTWKYAADTMKVPGGLADWIGRFLTQFFMYSEVGAALIALTLVAVHKLCWCASGRTGFTTYVLSLIPALMLWVFLLDENALMGAPVAIILSLLAFLAVRRMGEPPRRVAALLLIPVMYFLAGGLSLIFVLLCCVEECRTDSRGRIAAAVMLAVAMLCPLVGTLVFPYPAVRLYFGIHYHRYHNIIHLWPWLSVLACFLICLASALRIRIAERAQLWSGLSAAVILAAATVPAILSFSDMEKEEIMHYDWMVRYNQWNNIMMAADVKSPDKPFTVSCLNLALSKSGRMADHMFEYFQNGPEGLLPTFVRESTSPLPTSEIYWQLGMVNTSQRYTFEAQEAIPDFQKSARCYKRLAQTNIVNGDWSVAAKYLQGLENTLFYKAWATRTLEQLADSTVFQKQPDLELARQYRLKEHDFLFSETETDSMLGLLTVENEQNTTAMDYLMSWCLLRKDLDRFTQCISLLHTPSMPKSYQEALLLKWVLTHNDFEGLPPYISGLHAQRISAFLTDGQAGMSQAEMEKKYGDTYWFYYYYRYRAE